MGQCTAPLKGYRGLTGQFVTNPQDGYKDQPLTIRCGRCMGCRLERARLWAIRCFHEAQLHDENIFVTLSYDEENLPYGNTLHRPHMQNFLKRLRKKVPPLRVFYCGEYGGETDRAHYHALLFGWEPDDKELIAEKGDQKTYISKKLTDTWTHGYVSFSDVTFTSASYVASYTIDKVLGPTAENYYRTVDPDTGEIIDRVPPFSGQSMRPGIGQPWIKKFLYDTYKNDSVVINGLEMRPPPYYDKQCKKLNPELWRKVSMARAKKHHRPLKKEGEKFGYLDKNIQDKTYYGTQRQMLCNQVITKSKQKKRKETQ